MTSRIGDEREVRSLREAAAFVDRVGIALVFPRDRIPLPSLWGAVASDRPVEWAVKDEEGVNHFTPEMEMVWAWKDELAAQKLACSGKHLRGWATLMSLDLLPSFYALGGLGPREDGFRRAELSTLEREVAEAVLVMGPISSPDIRRAIGATATSRVNRAIDRLQRALILTKAGTQPQEHGWPAGTFDVLARRYRLGKLPRPDEARLRITRVLDPSDAGALARMTGWTKRDAATAFDAPR